jgi:hypothetical protein
MIGYPTNRLLMVIDDSSRAPDVVAAVIAAGIPAADVAVLVGDEGVEALRQLGGSGGPGRRVVRTFQFMSMDQMPDFVMYEASLRDGRAVLAVRPQNRTQTLAARDAAAALGAHFANWFGRLSTEELSRWQGPEPSIPNYLRR